MATHLRLNNYIMALTYLSLKVAEAITSSTLFQLQDFVSNAPTNQWIPFTHYNFYYSYPEWSKKWHNIKDHTATMFHKIETACHCCRKTPTRNYAGVGTLYMLKSNINNKDKRAHKLLLFCSSCVKWRNTMPYKHNNISAPKIYNTQLSLF